MSALATLDRTEQPVRVTDDDHGRSYVYVGTIDNYPDVPVSVHSCTGCGALVVDQDTHDQSGCTR